MGLNIFHYNKAKQEYKSFNIDPTDDNDAVFVSIAAGSKATGNKERLVIKMNKQELAYLTMEGKKIYNSLEDKE